MKFVLLAITHLLFGLIGFAAGIYALPILTAPTGPSSAEVASMSEKARFRGEFRRDLEGSDFLHWGAGQVAVSDAVISFRGEIAPGPDYRLYLSPEFVQTEAEVGRIKDRMAWVGEVKTFENFVVRLPDGVDPADYNTVLVWCESFGEFITAATYR